MTYNKTLQRTRGPDHWSTPPALKDELYKEFGLDFDPCPLMSDEDGRTIKWNGRVFCNPPYSKIPDFIKKGLYHLAAGDCSILVYLVPARTDTAWFHDYCYGNAEVRFLRGRLKFGQAEWSAPFPSMVVVFREWKLDPLWDSANDRAVAAAVRNAKLKPIR